MAEFRKRTVRVSNEGKVFELEIEDEPQSQISKIVAGDELIEEPQYVEVPEETFLWNRKATLLLIKTRLDMDNDFINPSVKKIKLWQRIANILKQNSIVVPAGKCDDKWRNLLQTYRKIKRRKGDRGSSWQYFSAIDQALKNRIQMFPLKNRKMVRLSDVLKRKRTEESDFYSSDSCYSDQVNDMVIERDEPRSRPEIIRVHPEVSSRISRELSKTYFQESNNHSFHQPIRAFSSSPNASFSPRVQVENSARASIISAAKVQVGNSSSIRVEDSPPSWLNLVMHKLEERDKNAEARESERWKNLLALIESHREVELEKVKAINNLTDLLEKHFNQKPELT